MFKYCKKLEQDSFIILLRSSMTYNIEEDDGRLYFEYTRFIDRIQTISKLENHSKLDSLQALARVKEILNQLHEVYEDQKSVQYILTCSALSLVDFEQRMIYLQLKYPGIREIATQRRHSPLKISKRFTNSDLMEVIAALSAVGFFCQQDDSPATFMQITREFETLCNTSFKNPDNCRWAVLNRKNRLTHFLDTLRGTLVELSQK
jgi:exopolyphosphatase/pppGpp-phosphohydrolase